MRRRAGVVAVAAALAIACARGPFDLTELEARHPALAALPRHHLAQITPYVLPWEGWLYWFTCRWPDDRALAVSLPEDLTGRERELIGLALASLEASGPGPRFRADASPAHADIVLRVGAEAEARGKSGRTAADCAVVVRDRALDAALVAAEVTLQRSNENVLGKAVPLSDAEWLGTAIHELGHALGFQGHGVGRGPMVRNVEQVRAIGRRVLAGRRLEAPTLRALYALPSGAVLRRDRLPEGRTDALDRLARLAAPRGYRGPFVRVGDEAARVEWRDPRGRFVSVWLPDLHQAIARPATLRLVPDPIAQAWLAGLR